MGASIQGQAPGMDLAVEGYRSSRKIRHPDPGWNQDEPRWRSMIRRLVVSVSDDLKRRERNNASVTKHKPSRPRVIPEGCQPLAGGGVRHDRHPRILGPTSSSTPGGVAAG